MKIDRQKQPVRIAESNALTIVRRLWCRERPVFFFPRFPNGLCAPMDNQPRYRRRRGGMMRVALISDIHGNAFALDTVLADIQEQAVDRMVCLGDVVQGGAQPAATVQRLRSGCASWNARL